MTNTPNEDLPEWAAETLASFRAALPGKSARKALVAYRQQVEALIAEARAGYLAGAESACAKGCSACCHQTLAVGLVELCALFFDQEERFVREGFRRTLTAELQKLLRWHRMGAVRAVDFSRLQWKEWSPCLFLGRDGQCTVYAERPVMCRNLFSKLRCTQDRYLGTGSETIGQLARAMRRAIFRHLRLGRFSTPRLDLETHQFLLPQGLRWMLEEAPLPELREVFRG